MNDKTPPLTHLKMENSTIKNAFNNYFNGLKELRNQGVLLNSKDFTSQLGEWIVEEYYNGKRSENGIQKYWDVISPKGKIQVKTHAKSDKNAARWSNLKKIQTSEIDFIVIIVFTKDYQLKEFYNAPWNIAYGRIREHKDADRIYWDDLNEYKIQLNQLKENSLLNLFL